MGRDSHLNVLSALAQAIATRTDQHAFYSRIAEAAVETLGARAARVWLNEPASGTVSAAGSFGVDPDVERELLDTVRLRHGDGIPGLIVLTRHAEFIEDAHGDPRWANARYISALNLHAYAGLPLVAGDAVVGVLSVLFGTARAFSAEDRAIAGVLADYAAISVRIAQLSNERRRADALDAVIRLANATAHEINNPLAVIVGQLALIELDLADDPRLLRRVVNARMAAHRLADVVRRMSRIVRVEGFDPTSASLPPMLDIRRSGREEPAD